MAKAPQKSKEAKAKAAQGGGKKSKKKWSKARFENSKSGFKKKTYFFSDF